MSRSRGARGSSPSLKLARNVSDIRRPVRTKAGGVASGALPRSAARPIVHTLTDARDEKGAVEPQQRAPQADRAGRAQNREDRGRHKPRKPVVVERVAEARPQRGQVRRQVATILAGLLQEEHSKADNVEGGANDEAEPGHPVCCRRRTSRAATERHENAKLRGPLVASEHNPLRSSPIQSLHTDALFPNNRPPCARHSTLDLNPTVLTDTS